MEKVVELETKCSGLVDENKTLVENYNSERVTLHHFILISPQTFLYPFLSWCFYSSIAHLKRDFRINKDRLGLNNEISGKMMMIMKKEDLRSLTGQWRRIIF